ncbi:MAG: hypothetical protein KGL46_12185 [Hyphomicrobiales bacterium]|nr:hypothetical protein [Hyphomicrobiales bacterium]
MRARLPLFAIMLATGLAASPAEGADIEWRIAHRFRLFKSEQQFQAIEAVYRALPQPASALALETELELRAAKKDLGPAFGDGVSLARYGWASAVAPQVCFQAGNKGHWPCRLDNGEQFLQPKTFDVLARLKDIDAASGATTCRWTIDGRTLPPQRCDAQVRLRGVRFGQTFDLAALRDGAPFAALGGQQGRIVTIVGLGDSFSSGEGNPDRAAAFGVSTSDYNGSSRMPGGGLIPQHRAYPLRLGAGADSFGAPRARPQWLSAQCHRSLYSQQAKAALQLALEQPHVAVDFLGYACTGATVAEGLLGYAAARDDVAARYYDASPQIMRVLRDICATPNGYARYRQPAAFDWRRDIKPCARRRVETIDALLLDIGGNDIGFANVIANESVDAGAEFSPFRDWLYRLWLAQAKPIPFEQAEQNARDRLPHAYAQLAEAFERLLAVDGSRVVQTAYPQMTRLENGAVCPPTTDGMDVHEILGMRKADTGARAALFVERVNRIMADAVAALPPTRRWTIATAHVEQFAGHAICRSGAPQGDPDAAMAGDMHFPVYDFNAHRWRGIFPPAWAAYRPKNRWFVTPNDSFLTGHYMNTRQMVDPLDRAQPLIAALLGGAFHPNALGHAAIADAVLPRLRAILQLPPP